MKDFIQLTLEERTVIARELYSHNIKLEQELFSERCILECFAIDNGFKSVNEEVDEKDFKFSEFEKENTGIIRRLVSGSFSDIGGLLADVHSGGKSSKKELMDKFAAKLESIVTKVKSEKDKQVAISTLDKEIAYFESQKAKSILSPNEKSKHTLLQDFKNHARNVGIISIANGIAYSNLPLALFSLAVGATGLISSDFSSIHRNARVNKLVAILKKLRSAIKALKFDKNKEEKK